MLCLRHLAGSVGMACNSWSPGREFKPHIGQSSSEAVPFIILIAYLKKERNMSCFMTS